MLSHEKIATQLSPPVQTTKNTRNTKNTSGPHLTTLRKIVTRLFLPVIHTSPQPNHLQHTNKYPQRHTYIPLTHIHNAHAPYRPHHRGGGDKAIQHHSREKEAHIKSQKTKGSKKNIIKNPHLSYHDFAGNLNPRIKYPS